MTIQYTRINRRRDKNTLYKIYAVEKDSFSPTWTFEELQEWMKQKRIFCYVAREGSALVGFIVFKRYKKFVHLLNISVSSSFRKGGVGTSLLNKIKNSSIHLEVSKENKDAIQFYFKKGFKVIGKKVDYYGNKKDALIMIKQKEAL